MPLDKSKNATGKDIKILTRENKARAKQGKPERSRAQIIAIALKETGKSKY